MKYLITLIIISVLWLSFTIKQHEAIFINVIEVLELQNETNMQQNESLQIINEILKGASYV